MAKRIMVVDDSRATRDMVAFTLRRAGYDVSEAEDGSKALAGLGSKAVDCVIADLNMPVMDGLDLIRALRASPVHRATPILMLTTETDTDKMEEGKRAGATNWLNKPFHPQSLVEAVARMV